MSINTLTKVNTIIVINMEEFKDRLKELRSEAGVSMEQLAQALGVSNAAICKWENGIAEPKVTYLIRLADYFECTVDYIVGKTDDFGKNRAPQAEPPIKLTQKERQLIGAFRKMGPVKKALLKQTIDAWNQTENN